MTDLRDLVELVRLPAALTVPGDSLAGAAAAHWPYGPRTVGLPVASACLYWAGMALNDWADRELDAAERPDRPIPSGRVPPRLALALAGGLSLAGVAAAAVVGGRDALVVAVPLAGTVWAYDLALKPTPAGPVAMGTARALDVLLGAGGRHARVALPAALTVGAHTVSVTVLSRGEVSGWRGSRVPAATLAGTCAVAAAAVLPASVPAGRAARTATAALAAAYAGLAGSAQLRAVRDAGAVPVRRAVGTGILALMPLQGALAARAGAVRVAALVAVGLPLARRLAREVSPT